MNKKLLFGALMSTLTIAGSAYSMHRSEAQDPKKLHAPRPQHMHVVTGPFRETESIKFGELPKESLTQQILPHFEEFPGHTE